MRQQVGEIIGQGQHEPPGHIPFTKRAKKALELSMRESMQLGHNYIGTEHILLGLLREGDGVAAEVLVKLGADLNLVRQQVIQLLHGSGKRASTSLPDDALARIDALDHRLAAIERWAGMRPGLDELDRGRISRPPPRRATRRSSCSPSGPPGRRSGSRPLLAARRWPANWAG